MDRSRFIPSNFWQTKSTQLWAEDCLSYFTAWNYFHGIDSIFM